MTRETKKKSSSLKKTADIAVDTKRKGRTEMIDGDFADALIREVDEDVKNDHMKELWDKYGLYVIILVIVSLTLAVSFETIKAWKTQRDQAMTNSYLSTLELKNVGQLDKSLLLLQQISENGNGIYRDIAKLQTVNVLLEQGKTDEALSNLQQIVENEKINPTLKDAARLKLASLQFDNISTAELKAILAPLQENNEWAPYAKEFLAMAAIRDKNLSEARDIYNEIVAMPDLSDELRTRVKDMLSVLSE